MIQSREEFYGALKKYDTIVAVTHPGVFHADDVFAAAFLALFKEYFPRHTGITPAWIEIVRSANLDKYTYDNCIVFDIGLGKFDHHQTNSEIRPESTDENPLPYAAFGLLWGELAPLVFDDDFVKRFDESFVQAIDLQDNGVARNPLSLTISAMNPLWDSNGNPDTEFSKARTFAEEVLEMHFNMYFSNKRCESHIEKCIENQQRSGVISMATYMPASNYLKTHHPDIWFTVYPSNRNPGEFCVMAVDSTQHVLPKTWLETPPEGMTFCHKALFLAQFKTREQALTAANEAVNTILISMT